MSGPSWINPPTVDGITGDPVPSHRLTQVLRTYRRDLNRTGMHDLRSSLAAGRYPWLRQDLAVAFQRPARASTVARTSRRSGGLPSSTHSPQW